MAEFKAGAIYFSPAKTGNANNNKKEVTNTAQTNKGNLCQVKPGLFILITVVRILIPPNIELIPAKCKAKIAKSTEAPECDCILDNGG